MRVGCSGCVLGWLVFLFSGVCLLGPFSLLRDCGLSFVLVLVFLVRYLRGQSRGRSSSMVSFGFKLVKGNRFMGEVLFGSWEGV